MTSAKWSSVFGGYTGDSVHHKPQYYTPEQLLPVATARALWPAEYCKRLQELTGLADGYFGSIYLATCEQFSAYVQTLPLTLDLPLRSLLNSSLKRGFDVLYQYQQDESMSQVHEQFAVFSAGLLLDVGKLLTEYSVLMTDSELETFCEWLPLLGPMTHWPDYKYFRLEPKSNQYQRHIDVLTPMLAQRILSPSALMLLMNDPQVFDEWLAILSGGDESGVGRLVKVLQLYRQQLKPTGGYGPSFPNDELPLQDSIHTDLADRFSKWLRENIDNNTLEVNSANASIHVLKDGLLIESSIIDRFTDYIRAYINVTANIFPILQQLHNLFGCVELSGDDFRNERYRKFNHTSSNNSSRVSNVFRDFLQTSNAAYLFSHNFLGGKFATASISARVYLTASGLSKVKSNLLTKAMSAPSHYKSSQPLPRLSPKLIT